MANKNIGKEYTEFQMFALAKVFKRHVSTIERWCRDFDERLELEKAKKACEIANKFENDLYEMQGS